MKRLVLCVILSFLLLFCSCKTGEEELPVPSNGTELPTCNDDIGEVRREIAAELSRYLEQNEAALTELAMVFCNRLMMRLVIIKMEPVFGTEANTLMFPKANCPLLLVNSICLKALHLSDWSVLSKMNGLQKQRLRDLGCLTVLTLHRVCV